MAALSGVEITNPVIIIQSQGLVKPSPIPPVPSKAVAFSRSHHVPADLFLHPILNKAKSATGVANPKVIHPATKNWVNQIDYPIYGLRYVVLEYGLKPP